MDNAIYITLTRQSGLMREMRTLANNIANVSTTGFRREGVIFSEYLSGLEGNEPSLSSSNQFLDPNTTSLNGRTAVPQRLSASATIPRCKTYTMHQY